MAPERVHKFLNELFENDMHAARVLSLSNAVSGAIQAAALSVHAIGQGLAPANQLEVNGAIKQVDRSLSNMKLSVWELFPLWVAYLLSERSEAVVALDWTEFDKEGHATIALNLLTRHGRAAALGGRPSSTTAWSKSTCRGSFRAPPRWGGSATAGSRSEDGFMRPNRLEA